MVTPFRFRLLIGVMLGGLTLFVLVGSGVAGYVLAYLVQDFVDVVTVFCARIYGQRAASNRAKAALAAAEAAS